MDEARKMILNYGNHKPFNGVNVDLQAYPNVDIVIEPDSLPFKDETFEIVISNQVMEHNFHIEYYYREAARVLKPNGYMFLHFPHRFQPYDGHTKRFFRHWFENRPGFNWKSRRYHKRIARKYFACWVDLAPCWRQVKAILIKPDHWMFRSGVESPAR